MAYRPTSYTAAQTNVVYFNAKSYSSNDIQLTSNSVGGTVTVSCNTQGKSSDTWTEVTN